MTAHNITNATEPKNAQDVAIKNYVDSVLVRQKLGGQYILKNNKPIEVQLSDCAGPTLRLVLHS